MAVSTAEAILHLHTSMGPQAADVLADWMQGIESRLAAAGLTDAGDIDSRLDALESSVGTAEGTIVTIVDDLYLLAAKLDLDATVTDEDYEATLTTPANPAE
jgi:hypothetical protein